MEKMGDIEGGHLSRPRPLAPLPAGLGSFARLKGLQRETIALVGIVRVFVARHGRLIDAEQVRQLGLGEPQTLPALS